MQRRLSLVGHMRKMIPAFISIQNNKYNNAGVIIFNRTISNNPLGNSLQINYNIMMKLFSITFEMTISAGLNQ